ncbi:hypothetical protein [Aliivibrio sifiae]|uniref:Uncharacterized protein n=1 Tax=Aliivibrio sifiae TaxID=566293 RepID=A0A2S7X863_9GAMM|nr:hypothetical protein [Aliivibrio sifiae]PQJ87521.1 hypothetical protein BTO23_15560 [Aliivibrio sifiae]GLR77123.1 hypothetical protein GCM10007855_39980 [Aliivibrio sifiae]
MKVKELQEKLANLDSDLQLIFYTEDEGMLKGKESFKLFEMLDVSVIDAERVRDVHGKPTLVIGKSEEAISMAVLNISSDF